MVVHVIKREEKKIMKTKNLNLSILASFFLFINCTSENTTASDLVIENQILKFDTYEDMQNRIIEITNINKTNESNILNSILDQNKKETINTNQVEFYHQERLKSIYELRNKINFTSIQSIADEINSLKLLNPKEADALYNKYSELLIKSKFSVYPIVDNELALVSNFKGEVIINGEKINLISKSKTTTSKYIGVDYVREGVLLTNGVYCITWHAGRTKHRDDIGRTFWRNFTQLGSNILVNNVWVQYPSSMRPLLDAHAEFAYGGLFTENVGFPADYGSVIRNYGAQHGEQHFPVYVKTGGTFTTTVNGVEMKLEGQSIFTTGYGL